MIGRASNTAVQAPACQCEPGCDYGTEPLRSQCSGTEHKEPQCLDDVEDGRPMPECDLRILYVKAFGKRQRRSRGMPQEIVQHHSCGEMRRRVGLCQVLSKDVKRIAHVEADCSRQENVCHPLESRLPEAARRRDTFMLIQNRLLRH